MEEKCVSCGAIIPEGRQVCPSCDQGKKSRWAERVETLTKLQRCVRCGAKDAYTMAGHKRCYECTEKDKVYQRNWNKKHREELNKHMHERYERLKAEGICVSCGQRKAREGMVMCQRCATKSNLSCKRSLARKERSADNGGK